MRPGAKRRDHREPPITGEHKSVREAPGQCAFVPLQ